MSATGQARHVGIVVKHRSGCASERGARCNCQRVYQAAVWSARDARRIRKHFDSLSDAKSWRADSYTKLRRRELRAPSAMTFGEAAALWLLGVRAGSIRTRSGDEYKPSTIRSYEQALRGGRAGNGLLAELGAIRLSDLSIDDVQAYADRLLAQGAQPSTIHNQIMPVRVICRWRRREVAVNPTIGLTLPAVRSSRVRIVSPPEAEMLLAALGERDRALWATALYAGLRRGELMGLRWCDVDLARGVLEIAQAWDPKERCMVAPKSAAGTRRVPIAAALRAFLEPLSLQAASHEAERLVFGAGGVPFSSTTLYERSLRAWRKVGLWPICLHDCRHTFASLMIAAGVNAKALSTFMGHATISITLDRYGHLMPGAEDEAAALMDAYLQGARAGSS